MKKKWDVLSHFERSELKYFRAGNIPSNLLTLDTTHFDRSTSFISSESPQPMKRSDSEVTLLRSQSPIFPYLCGNVQNKKRKENKKRKKIKIKKLAKHLQKRKENLSN